MRNKKVSFNNLSSEQKVNYVKNLLFNHDLTSALDMMLKEEKKDLGVIKTINEALKEDLIINRIKQECNIKSNAKIFVYSKIISILAFYNKQIILEAFFKSLDTDTLKDLAFYEYQNRTLVSISSGVFKKYCSKYKEEARKSIAISNEEILMLTTGMDRYNFIYKKSNSKRKKVIKYLSICILIILCFLMGYKIYDINKDINKYDNLIFNGIYIGDTNLSTVKISNLENYILKEKDKIENGTVTIKNINGSHVFTYKEIGITTEYENVLEEIKKYNSNLSWFKKAMMLNSKKRYKTFYIESNFSDNALNDFVLLLEQKLNTKPVADGIKIDENHNVYYDEGKQGFTLDSTKMLKDLKNTFSYLKQEIIIEAQGEVIKQEKKNTHLSVIDKKVASYKTYFLNSGNRGYNVVLAASKLNGTVLMPNETFSYLKEVGPYTYKNGYKSAPAYINGVVSYASGGGVCQLATTLYNAQLIAGLETVYRSNHIFAPDYVPKGLDASVFSNTVDYKFKNQYKYPMYIVSYVIDNYLYVDIWSSKDALGTKTYEAYSVYSNGGYSSYLKEYDNGVYVGEKYLGRSYYRSK